MADIPKVMGRLVELADAMGARRIDQLAGCWEVEIGKWWLALNGHSEPTKCTHGFTVPAISLYVEFNEWPAGVIDFGGGVLAAGDAANEAELVRALEAKIEEVKGSVANV